MKLRGFLSIALAFLVLVAGMQSAFGQAANVKPSVVTGDVTSIEAGKIVLQTKDGMLDVTLTEKTIYKRVPPENPDPKAAVASSLSDISIGDKLLVTGIFGDVKTVLPARSVYLMTKSDIAQKQVKESERWASRGISGRVAAVDQITKQIKVEVRGIGNMTTVVLTPKDDVKFRRYAPNSVKFSEAQPSTLNEVQAGDMLRAVGDRSADGASFSAEEIVTGAFRTVAGTVKTIDTAKNEVVITDAQSKKDITVELGSASTLKRFPEEMAQRMAGAQASGPGGVRPGPAGAGTPGARPQGGPPNGGQAGPGGPGGRGPGGARAIDDMFERFPDITAADLKTGEVIAVSSTRNMTPERITAIKLLAGVEPFLRAAQAQAASASRGGQGTLSLDIPGLDGFGGP
jgi:hypothetical protein